MSEMRQLYQEVILDHNRKPRNFGALPGALPGANRHAEGHNPVCGDHIKLAVNVQDDKIIPSLLTARLARYAKRPPR